MVSNCFKVKLVVSGSSAKQPNPATAKAAIPAVGAGHPVSWRRRPTKAVPGVGPGPHSGGVVAGSAFACPESAVRYSPSSCCSWSLLGNRKNTSAMPMTVAMTPAA